MDRRPPDSYSPRCSTPTGNQQYRQPLYLHRNTPYMNPRGNGMSNRKMSSPRHNFPSPDFIPLGVSSPIRVQQNWKEGNSRDNGMSNRRMSSPRHNFPSPRHNFPSPRHNFPSPSHNFPSPSHNFPSPSHNFPSPEFVPLGVSSPIRVQQNWKEGNHSNNSSYSSFSSPSSSNSSLNYTPYKRHGSRGNFRGKGSFHNLQNSGSNSSDLSLYMDEDILKNPWAELEQKMKHSLPVKSAQNKSECSTVVHDSDSEMLDGNVFVCTTSEKK